MKIIRFLRWYRADSVRIRYVLLFDKQCFYGEFFY